MSEPVARRQAKVDGTFGAALPYEQREAKPPFESVDVEGEKNRQTQPDLPFTRRERHDEVATGPGTGPPANRVPQEPQPFNQRVRRGDVERLGLSVDN